MPKQLIGEPKMDLMDLGTMVLNARKTRKMTRDALAELCGVSRARIEAFENGRALDMKFGSVVAILEGVGLEMRVATYNAGRPTLDDLQEESNAPGFN